MALYPDVIESEVTVEGANVRIYDSGGETDTPTIVLVHGAGGSAEAHFWALYPMLAFGHRVVAMDLVIPSDPHRRTLETFAAQVEAVVETIRDDRGVLLVGYSLGVAVAVLVAARRADLVDAFVSVAGWARSDRSVRHYADLAQTIGAAAPNSLPDFRVYSSYSPEYVASLIDADYEGLRQRAAGPVLPSELFDLMRDVDVLITAEAIAQPSLVIGCSFDRIAHPVLAQALFGALEHGRYAEVQAGHAVLTERPAEVFALIDEFASDREQYPAGAIIPQADW